LEPNTLDGQGPKPKPLTRPQCSWLRKAKAKESVLDISFDTDEMMLIHILEFFPTKNIRRN